MASSPRAHSTAAALLSAITLSACSTVAGSGEIDASGGDSEVDGAIAAAAPEPPAMPVVVPCPDGWREVAGDTGVVACEPWSRDGPLACPDDEAHFPGEAGCALIGTTCPADGLPDALPADRTILYVRAGSTGGDGTRSRPYGALADFALGRVRPATIVAMGVGRYDGVVPLPVGVTVWGACVRDTILTTSEPYLFDGVVVPQGTGEVRNLQIADAPRPAVVVEGLGREVHLEQVLLARVGVVGAYAVEDGRLTARRLVVRETAPDVDGSFGAGVVAEFFGVADIAHAVLERNHAVGLFVDDEAAEATVSDVAIREMRAEPVLGEEGIAVNLQRAATATISRGVFEDNLSDAVLVTTDSTLQLSNAVVRGTPGRETDDDFGRGIGAQSGAVVGVTATLIEANRDVAVFADAAGTDVRLADFVVRDTAAQGSDDTAGRGISIQGGAAMTASRGHVERSLDAGCFVDGAGSTLDATDIVIRDVESRLSDGTGGRGLAVQGGATARIVRVVIERPRDIGVVAFDVPDAARLEHASVSDVRAQACADSTCATEPAGHGLVAIGGGGITARSFDVGPVALCGVFIARDGAIDLMDGTIHSSAIGACLQVMDYDQGRLTTRVTYSDNGVNLQATDLPVPATSAPDTP